VRVVTRQTIAGREGANTRARLTLFALESAGPINVEIVDYH